MLFVRIKQPEDTTVVYRAAMDAKAFSVDQSEKRTYTDVASITAAMFPRHIGTLVELVDFDDVSVFDV